VGKDAQEFSSRSSCPFTLEVITIQDGGYPSPGLLESYSERVGTLAPPARCNSLRPKMSPATQERAHRLAAKYLAKILRVNQAAVSKIERREDMEVSTLHDFVKAMGGELKITAKFPEGTIEITQFEVVKKAAAGKDQAVGAKMTRSFGHARGEWTTYGNRGDSGRRRHPPESTLTGIARMRKAFLPQTRNLTSQVFCVFT
jgi:hypothetical protein